MWYSSLVNANRSIRPARKANDEMRPAIPLAAIRIGLASLTIPAVLLLATSPVPVAAPIFAAALGILLFRGLLRPEVRAYLNEV